jgi:hypothetical protein
METNKNGLLSKAEIKLVLDAAFAAQNSKDAAAN